MLSRVLRLRQLGELVAQAPNPLPLAELMRVVWCGVVDVEDILVPRLQAEAAVQHERELLEFLVFLAALAHELGAALEHPNALEVENRLGRAVNWSSSRTSHRHLL